MEIGRAQAATQQQVQRPREIDVQERQPQVAADSEQVKTSQKSQQVQMTPPAPDQPQGQTFSRYA